MRLRNLALKNKLFQIIFHIIKFNKFLSLSHSINESFRWSRRKQLYYATVFALTCCNLRFILNALFIHFIMPHYCSILCARVRVSSNSLSKHNSWSAIQNIQHIIIYYRWVCEWERRGNIFCVRNEVQYFGILISPCIYNFSKIYFPIANIFCKFLINQKWESCGKCFK
jgi:hypothetical protein